MPEVPPTLTPAPTSTPNATSNTTLNATSVTLPEPLGALGQGVFPNDTIFAVQALVTVLIIVIVSAARFYENKWASSLAVDSPKRVALAGGIAVFTALGVVLLVDLWSLGNNLARAFANLNDQEQAGKVLISGVLLGITYTLTNFIGRLIQLVTGTGEAISRHQREIIFRLTQVFLYTTVILVVISLFTNNLGSLLVGAGFLGIIVGMAARQTLGAMLAGFVLMFSRPFEIGDWIVVGDKEGTVTDITIVNTRIQTFDGEYVILPNDEVSGDAITNRTRKGRLRVEIEVGVDYDNDPERASDVALDAVDTLDEVLDVPSPQVVLKSFADSAVLLGIRFWVDNPSARRLWRARTAAVAELKTAFEREGIKIPYPQRELMSRQEEGGFRLAENGRSVEATTDGGEK